MTENSEGLTLEEWLEFTGCVPKTIEWRTVGGEAAISCTSEAGEIPTAAILFERAGTMFYITATLMPPAEFDLLISSIEL